MCHLGVWANPPEMRPASPPPRLQRADQEGRLRTRPGIQRTPHGPKAPERVRQAGHPKPQLPRTTPQDGSGPQRQPENQRVPKGAARGTRPGPNYCPLWSSRLRLSRILGGKGRGGLRNGEKEGQGLHSFPGSQTFLRPKGAC